MAHVGEIGRTWRPTTRGNIKIIEWKTHASPKQFNMQIPT
jgi:hypothetical protein